MYQIFGIVVLTGVLVCIWQWWKTRRLTQALDWPLADGYVAQIEESRDDNGFLTITLAYTYKVHDERYVGRESFVFIRDEDAARFEAGSRQRSVKVHYRPDKPHISALAREKTP